MFGMQAQRRKTQAIDVIRRFMQLERTIHRVEMRIQSLDSMNWYRNTSMLYPDHSSHQYVSIEMGAKDCAGGCPAESRRSRA